MNDFETTPYEHETHVLAQKAANKASDYDEAYEAARKVYDSRFPDDPRGNSAYADEAADQAMIGVSPRGAKHNIET